MTLTRETIPMSRKERNARTELRMANTGLEKLNDAEEKSGMIFVQSGGER